MMVMEYAVVIEKGAEGYGAFVPDLLGCVAVARTKVAVRALIREAIAFHIEGLREFGEPVPLPSCEVSSVRVAARRRVRASVKSVRGLARGVKSRG